MRGQRLAQVLADDVQVMRRVVVEQPFNLIADLCAQVQKVAVEILPAFQLVTAQRDVHHHLLQANRVGHGHQHDFAVQAACAFQLGQALFQVPGHQHAGQFIGVQRSLNVNLALWLGRAVMKAVNMPFGAGNRCQQGMGLMSLHVKVLVGRAEKGQPAALRQSK